MQPEIQKKVLGLVPARGGSKGIPRKNVRLLRGKPLLEYTAQVARESARLARTVLSTDDEEIAELGRKIGLEVPFLRPAELAQDGTPMVDVILHALAWVEGRGEPYDAVCLLQPTSPLRSAATIDRCIALLWERAVDTVISVRPVPAEYNPHWVYFESSDGLLRGSLGQGDAVPSRQQLPRALHRDGSVFLARTKIVTERHSLYGDLVLGYESPAEEACDLDTEEQWEALERRMDSMRASGLTDAKRR